MKLLAIIAITVYIVVDFLASFNDLTEKGGWRSIINILIDIALVALLITAFGGAL